MEISERLNKLPPYLFVKIDQLKQKALSEGRDIIDLGIGDPDLPTPLPIVERMQEAVDKPAFHRYPSNKGRIELRSAISRWYERRFKVSLNPETEILPLIGSKEGIAHMPFAFLNEGDAALIPDPSYPPYRNSCILAGGVPYIVPLLEENDFLPDLTAIPGPVARKARLFFLNYPNNPTSAVAQRGFFEEVIEFAKINNVIVCHDAAYSELAFDGIRPISFLELAGARECGVEFHSFSKTYNMTGWRIGWVSGNADVIRALATVKSNIDSGIFEAVQDAGIAALGLPEEYQDQQIATFRRRRDILVDGLNALGWTIERPKATFYVWTKIPKGFDSSGSFSQHALAAGNMVITPGAGFGKYGEGYVRMALTVSEERLTEAVERFRKIL
ncbi:MAG: LL-diaminopimelate aminotransferase [Candidatus Omnitrophica bacterium]|nr:LL-diaminopimelate aminotransferase [Candidatus Omnitrophota bacterium]